MNTALADFVSPFLAKHSDTSCLSEHLHFHFSQNSILQDQHLSMHLFLYHQYERQLIFGKAGLHKTLVRENLLLNILFQQNHLQGQNHHHFLIQICKPVE